LIARAARVIQQGWRQYLDQRQLPGDLVARNRALELLLGRIDDPGARVIGESSLDDDKHYMYDPNNRLCPDGVPGCTCGSEYELAGILDNMWRNHKLGNLTAKAAQVIQQRWHKKRQGAHAGAPPHERQQPRMVLDRAHHGQ
jgi:hypothetical protein